MARGSVRRSSVERFDIEVDMVMVVDLEMFSSRLGMRASFEIIRGLGVNKFQAWELLSHN
jgi:hypothetical protein